MPSLDPNEIPEDTESFSGNRSNFVWRSTRRAGSSDVHSRAVRTLIEMLDNNDTSIRILRLHNFVRADVSFASIELIFEALLRNTSVEVLYCQNLTNEAMNDAQMDLLIKILKRGTIWALNAGELYNITTEKWTEFAHALPHTNVTHLYTSEHTISTELKDELILAARKNRRTDPRHLCMHRRVLINLVRNMWWNPKLPLLPTLPPDCAGCVVCHSVASSNTLVVCSRARCGNLFHAGCATSSDAAAKARATDGGGGGGAGSSGAARPKVLCGMCARSPRRGQPQDLLRRNNDLVMRVHRQDPFWRRVYVGAGAVLRTPGTPRPRVPPKKRIKEDTQKLPRPTKLDGESFLLGRVHHRVNRLNLHVVVGNRHKQTQPASESSSFQTVHLNFERSRYWIGSDVVWVRLAVEADGSGLHFHPAQGENSSQTIWWPGQIVFPAAAVGSSLASNGNATNNGSSADRDSTDAPLCRAGSKSPENACMSAKRSISSPPPQNSTAPKKRSKSSSSPNAQRSCAVRTPPPQQSEADRAAAARVRAKKAAERSVLNEKRRREKVASPAAEKKNCASRVPDFSKMSDRQRMKWALQQSVRDASGSGPQIDTTVSPDSAQSAMVSPPSRPTPPPKRPPKAPNKPKPVPSPMKANQNPPSTPSSIPKSTPKAKTSAARKRGSARSPAARRTSKNISSTAGRTVVRVGVVLFGQPGCRSQVGGIGSADGMRFVPMEMDNTESNIVPFLGKLAPAHVPVNSNIVDSSAESIGPSVKHIATRASAAATVIQAVQGSSGEQTEWSSLVSRTLQTPLKTLGDKVGNGIRAGPQPSTLALRRAVEEGIYEVRASHYRIHHDVTERCAPDHL